MSTRRFARVLQDKLEEKMKGTPLDGTMKTLFSGVQQTYCKCINVEYESKRNEDFYDLSMNVKGFPTLHKSFENYVDVEEMRAPNQCVLVCLSFHSGISRTFTLISLI